MTSLEMRFRNNAFPFETIFPVNTLCIYVEHLNVNSFRMKGILLQQNNLN